MLRAIAAILVLCPALSLTAADESPAAAKFVDETYDKAVEANAAKAIKAYETYRKELEAANAAIAKSLNAAIKDLNEGKKLANLSLKERAAAVDAFNARLAALKAGTIDATIMQRCSDTGDLLGDGKAGTAKEISQLVVGKWANGTNIYTVVPGLVCSQTLYPALTGYVSIDKTARQLVFTWGNGRRETYDYDEQALGRQPVRLTSKNGAGIIEKN